MSKDLMDTEPGGEQTQYEGAIHDHLTPHAKSAGQLGSEEDQTTTDPDKANERQQESTGSGQQKVGEGQKSGGEESGRKPGGYGGDVGGEREM